MSKHKPVVAERADTEPPPARDAINPPPPPPPARDAINPTPVPVPARTDGGVVDAAGDIHYPDGIRLTGEERAGMADARGELRGRVVQSAFDNEHVQQLLDVVYQFHSGVDKLRELITPLQTVSGPWSEYAKAIVDASDHIDHAIESLP